MQFRLIKRRSMASLATSALVAGALTVPVALMASPAQAASAVAAYTCDLTMTGGQAANGGPRQATLTFDTNAASAVEPGSTTTPTLTATLTFDPAYADLFEPSPVNRMGGTLTAATDTDGTPGTAPITFTQWDRVGGMGTPIDNISMTGTGSWGDISATELGDIQLGVGNLTGTLFMGTSFTPNNTSIPTVCTPNGPSVTAVDTISVVDKDLSFACSFGANQFTYSTDIELSARARSGSTISVTADLADEMPNTAPEIVNMPSADFVGTLGASFGDLTGARTGSFQGGVPVAIPTLVGSTSGTGSTLAVTIEDLSLAVTNAGVSIPCTLSTPKTFTIDVAPKAQACVTAEAGLPAVQAGHTNATNVANAEAAGVSAATASVATATKAASKAKSSASKASKAVKKATKAVKKAKSKSKAKKAKAKKALTKSKKANTKAKKALTKANSQVKAAKAQLASASGKSAAANSQVAAAAAALAAAQNAVASTC